MAALTASLESSARPTSSYLAEYCFQDYTWKCSQNLGGRLKLFIGHKDFLYIVHGINLRYLLSIENMSNSYKTKNVVISSIIFFISFHSLHLCTLNLTLNITVVFIYKILR